MVSKIDNISKLPIVDSGYSEEQIETVINNFVSREEIVRQTPKEATLLNFFPVFQQVIRTQEEADNKNLLRSNKEEYRRLLLVEDQPEKEDMNCESLDIEAITWKLKARTPGRFDQGPAGQGRIQEVRPHLRAKRPHPEHPNETLLTYGKGYSNWIEFAVYARTKKQAMTRLLWLENAIGQYDWFFKFMGYIVVQEGVGARETVEIEGLNLIKYPIVYYVRTEDIYHVTSQNLKKVSISADIEKY